MPADRASLSTRLSAGASAGASSTLGTRSSGRIVRLEMYNFKSYSGRRVVGPFKNFTAVIGPNGAGKSNTMDACAFVSGVNSKELRGKQLKDLIYRSTADTGDEKRTASVTLVFEKDGKETAFKRSILSTGVGKYHIDGLPVSAEDYQKRLQAEGIMSDAHASFLVFQGYVSELAAKSPQELTELLEQISGSAQHKDEYERLEREKTKAENQASYAFQKKKLLVQERTNVAKQKKEAEEYAALQKGLKETRRKLELLRLFHLEKEVTERKQLAEEEAKEAEEVAAKKEEIELQVRTHEKEMAAQRSLVVTSERKAVDLAKKVDGRSPEQIQLQAEIEQHQKRKAMAAKSLEKLEKQQLDSETQMATLKQELDEIRARSGQLEAEAAAAEEAGDLELEGEQRREYNQLKAQASVAAECRRVPLRATEHLGGPSTSPSIIPSITPLTTTPLITP